MSERERLKRAIRRHQVEIGRCILVIIVALSVLLSDNEDRFSSGGMFLLGWLISELYYKYSRKYEERR